jgi:hypothetical protein
MTVSEQLTTLKCRGDSTGCNQNDSAEKKQNQYDRAKQSVYIMQHIQELCSKTNQHGCQWFTR